MILFLVSGNIHGYFLQNNYENNVENKKHEECKVQRIAFMEENSGELYRMLRKWIWNVKNLEKCYEVVKSHYKVLIWASAREAAGPEKYVHHGWVIGDWWQVHI